MNSNSTPSVSVVIPNFNGRDLMARHLPSVLRACPEAEIVVVDDASTDESVQFVRNRYPQIILVEQPKNMRFAEACNAGVTLAHGEIIILLNNDVSPEPDFLPPLLSGFTDSKVFAVGCQEEATINGKTVVSGRAGGTFTRGLYQHWRCQDQNQTSTLWVAGGSGAFRKSIWVELGGMDPLFAPAYEEDRDICYRALKRGYHLRFAPTSRVQHIHESTNTRALGQYRMKVSAHKNNLLFVWKNITDPILLTQHLLWLPYHLVVSSIKSQGQFLLGFLWAACLFPQVWLRRRIEKHMTTRSDRSIITYYQKH